MISAVWAWLRSRAWARWLALAIGALLAGAAAYLRGQSVGAERERARGRAANRDALGDELRADDALEARDRERAQIEAAERAVLVERARERLSHPPRTTEQAKAEATQRLERAARAADEDR